MKKIIKFILLALFLIIVIPRLRIPVLKAIYPLSYEGIIEEYSSKYNVDEFLVMGVISAESNFRYDALSHKNAKGLMQITSDTASWCIEHFGIDSAIDTYEEPRENIEIGCAYLEYLIDYFDGETETAIAAYNAGLGNVKEWLLNENYSDDKKRLKEIPFSETKDYVKKVFRRQEIYKKIYSK